MHHRPQASILAPGAGRQPGGRPPGAGRQPAGRAPGAGGLVSPAPGLSLRPSWPSGRDHLQAHDLPDTKHAEAGAFKGAERRPDQRPGLLDSEEYGLDREE
jgi:hypothetical protein